MSYVLAQIPAKIDILRYTIICVRHNMDVFIKWSAQRAAHITDRTRYGISAAPLHPDWTQEAVNDPEAFDDPIDPKYPYRRARTGYSEGYGGLITVIYLDLDGDYYGITAYPSNAKQRRKK